MAWCVRVSAQECVRNQLVAKLEVCGEHGFNADVSKSRMEEALVCTLQRLGFEKLRKEQDRVVRAFVGGRDVFAALPTGYGKSLCFALLPYLFDGLRQKTGSIAICVSPLTSLMMDKFSRYGLATEFVGEAQQDQGVIARPKWLQRSLVKVGMIAAPAGLLNFLRSL